ncbi:NAD-dependent epimerase/dehydratase family protein [Deinococcus yavapaiensis]|uniref:Nucleoside-diphosphate-sugar epimerase n=1 Tax=Deinococcus yavapaiensis KR-236 TaxID=694435 RepID=A0A318SMK1_9DEIO|nr:NAD(P)-dependent oxidoreductase [Deinococcus yavapaiensis]PYE55903.1 nucleoside-diphosphate-sugar epimerase [Deinococcus yavapaiensis KR-236]
MDGALVKRALVTGATGFLGQRLARRLRESGWNVWAFVREDVGQVHQALERDGIRLAVGNHRTLLQSVRPDIVFHLATLFIAEHTSEQVEALVDANIKFGAQLLEAMREADVERLVTAASFWQFDEHGDVLPLNLYAATKQAFDVLVRYYEDAYDLRSTTLVLYDTYGEGDARRKLLRLLRDALHSGETLRMSPGQQQIDLVHADDVARAFVLAADGLLDGSLPSGHHFVVSSGAPMTVQSLVAEVRRVTGKDLKVEWGARPYRHRERMKLWQGGERLPVWHPSVSLSEGLRRYLLEEHDK